MEHVCISPPYQILVVGDVASKEFHAACSIIQDEYRLSPKKFHKPIIKPLFEYKWKEYLCAERKRVGKSAWRIRQPVFVYANGCLIGDLSAVIRSGRKLDYSFKNIDSWKMSSAYEEYMSTFKRHFVYMDISIDERPVGRLKFMLYSEELPETSRRFADLCRGKTVEEEEAVQKEKEEEPEKRKTSKEAEDKGEEEKAKERGSRVRTTIVWEDNAWRPKIIVKRLGRCAPERKNWDDLRQIIEEEVERVCPDDETGEEEPAKDTRARLWYRDRRDSFHKWQAESLMRIAKGWWGQEGIPEDLGDEVTEPWRRPVMHVGGVVVHDGATYTHVHGVVMPQEWEREEEAEEKQQYATHVGGIVVHDGEPVVHVQGIVGYGHWDREEKQGLTPQPGHVVHVGGVVMLDGEAVMHVEGIEARGEIQTGDDTEEQKTDSEAKEGRSSSVRTREGGSRSSRSSVPRDDKSETHGEGDTEPDASKEKEENGDGKTEVRESGGGEEPPQEEKEGGEKEEENGNGKPEVRKSEGGETTPQEDKEDGGSEETEKKEGAEEANEGESEAEKERTDETETEGGETMVGDEKEAEKNEEGDKKEGDENEGQESKEEGEKKVENGENAEETEGEGEAAESQGQLGEDDDVVREGEVEKRGTVETEREAAEETKEEGRPETPEAPPPVMHVGGIVVLEGEEVMLVHGVVEQPEEPTEEPTEKPTEEPTQSVHVGGIVMHDGEAVVHIEGIVEHGHWEKPPKAPEEPARAVHIGGIVVHDGEPVVHVQGIVEHGQWKEPTKEPARATHVGGIAMHDGEPVVHVQGIVEYERWDEEKVPPPRWPQAGNVVHVGRIAMVDGRPVMHVEGIVRQPMPLMAPGHVMHLGGVVTHDGEDVVLCHGIVDHSEWDRPTWEELGYAEHVGGMVTVDGETVRHIAGIVNLRDLSLDGDAFVPKMNPCYKGSKIHRVVKGGWIQGGELDAKVMEVPECFPDESFSVPFSRRGVLAMARADTHHTNSTQFIVTLEPTPWMRCEYVAFGQLIEGEKVLRAIENVGTSLESPTVTISISDCGVLKNAEESKRSQQRRRRTTVKEEEEKKEQEELPRVPTEIFVRDMLIAMLTDVAAGMAKADSQKFLRQIRNAVTVEALLEVMDAMARSILREMKKDSKNQRRKMAQRRSMYGIKAGGNANFCGR
ncbi:uncharacterized protein LOC124153839 [Ischnura elegans]|uniref:uncharacterized protein LOC124153839 n=1 Tax=Ischnura elegans TaxID=197161 RepID=UPI001ED8BA01|nr:uncharacterized protein LOC124153839 [Ischnura elegans]